jgi:hypothetical protein
MPYKIKDIYKPVRHTVYDKKNIPEKNYVPVYKRVSKGRIYFIKGVENMWQVCRVCNKLKHEKEFPVHSEIDKYARRQLRNVCRGCHSDNRKLLLKLNMEQGKPPNNCQLCDKEKKLQLDHCHKTNKFRGWLCNDCNSGIGKLGDNIESLERAIQYLKGELKENKND